LSATLERTKLLPRHRPHRALNQAPPLAKPAPVRERAPTEEPMQLDRLRRRDRLGGLLREYEIAA
jgi:hypothetical protein